MDRSTLESFGRSGISWVVPLPRIPGKPPGFLIFLGSGIPIHKPSLATIASWEGGQPKVYLSLAPGRNVSLFFFLDVTH